MSLLAKAMEHKATRFHRCPSDEEIELAIAWLQSRVTYTQVAFAQGLKHGSASVYSRLAGAIKMAYERGIIQISGEGK